MKSLFSTLFTVFSVSLFAQVDAAIWDSLRIIKTDNYEIKVPAKWRVMPTGDPGPEQSFEASGLSLPPWHNKVPVWVSVFFAKQPAKNLEDARERTMMSYRNNADREFPVGFNDEKEKIKLASGEEAYILHTRFYRKSKKLNQSRYDLVVFSDRAQAGYVYTLSIQYDDSEYKYETNSNLSAFARKLFSYVTLFPPPVELPQKKETKK